MTRALYALLALAVFLLWTFLLIHSVRLETRAEIVLDSDGRPVEIVWQDGKYRLPTDDEIEEGRR